MSSDWAYYQKALVVLCVTSTVGMDFVRSFCLDGADSYRPNNKYYISRIITY